MSSAPKQRPLWRSSTLRGALLAALLIWLLLLITLLAVIDAAQNALFENTIERLREEVEELLDAAAATNPPEDLLALTPEPDWELLTDEQAEVYEESVARLHASGDDAALLGLYLIGEADDDLLTFAEGYPTALGAAADTALTLMRERLGTNTLAAFEATSDFRRAYLRSHSTWQAQEPVSRLAVMLELASASPAWHEDYCYTLHLPAQVTNGAAAAREGKAHENYSNVYATDIGQESWRVYAVGPLQHPQQQPAPLVAASAPQAYCAVLRVPLTGGGELHYGAMATESSRAILAAQESAGAIVLLTAITLLIVAILIAGRRLRRINAVAWDVQRSSPRRTPASSSRGRGRLLINDIDWLRALVERSIDDMERRIGDVRELSDGLAHDMRTPLTRLRNRIEFVDQDANVDSQHLEQLSKDADQLLETFNALLRIAELEQGTGQRDFRSFNLASLLLEVSELYEPAFSEQHIKLELALQTRDLTVRGDRGIWLQAMANVLDNALSYAPDSATVTIELANRDRPIVTVTDEGPGVPAAQLERLTERFYRGDGARTSAGTGLGLALVAAICKLHNVELRLTNVRAAGQDVTEPGVGEVNDTGLQIAFIWPRDGERD
ncbi:MAG: HAMP domain-containing sensor histidine kinase [Pseudomonadota bacterium]